MTALSQLAMNAIQLTMLAAIICMIPGWLWMKKSNKVLAERNRLAQHRLELMATRYD